MSVARGTTPTYTLTFEEPTLDLTEANGVYVTFRKGSKALTKTGEDIEVEAKQIKVYLTQRETLSFSTGEVKVQANWTTLGGKRASSNVASIILSEQLLEKELV